MRSLMNVLSGITSIYMLVIFIRIMLTWFSGISYGGPLLILSRLTDPYLNWFRRFRFLRAGNLDLSPIAAISVLSLMNQIFSTLAWYGRISLGLILALVLRGLWSAVSFLLGFCAVVLILRLIAYLTSRNIFSSFWRVIDTISQPLLYRINRILFSNRIVHYRTGLISAIAFLAILGVGLHFLVGIGVRLLAKLPF